MNTIFFSKPIATTQNQPFLWKKLRLCLLFLLISPFLFLIGCKRTIDYTNYLSEQRKNVLIYSGENYHVCVYDVEKEYPFVADGYVATLTHRTELFISAPADTTRCNVKFTVGNHTHAGEASFDSVKREYYFSCNEDVSDLSRLTVHLDFGESTYTIETVSVRTPQTISVKQAILSVVNESNELFTRMIEKNMFLGEIYVRLLYEDAPYYYVGVVNRSGNITAFLLDGETGAILARRDP